MEDFIKEKNSSFLFDMFAFTCERCNKEAPKLKHLNYCVFIEKYKQ